MSLAERPMQTRSTEAHLHGPLSRFASTLAAWPHPIGSALERIPGSAGVVVRAIWGLPAAVLILIIRSWRAAISPLYGSSCKYYPSCSAYGLESVRQHGAARGALMAGWRLFRCNPWSRGGVDDVPTGPAQPHASRRSGVTPSVGKESHGCH